MQNAAAEYLLTQVLTAPAERLHLMIVDAALRFARQGATALREGNREKSFETLSRSRACVNEMLVAINAEPNPELADRVKSLLVFVYRNLALADLQLDASKVDDAIRILEIHRETWVELMERIGPAASSSVARPPVPAPPLASAPARRDDDYDSPPRLSMVG